MRSALIINWDPQTISPCKQQLELLLVKKASSRNPYPATAEELVLLEVCLLSTWGLASQAIFPSPVRPAGKHIISLYRILHQLIQCPGLFYADWLQVLLALLNVSIPF